MVNAADKRKAFAFLSKHRVASIATVTPEGTPMSAIVYYVVDEDLNLFFLTKTDTAKYVNIRNNPAVSMAICDEADLATVQVEGTATEVKQEVLIGKIFRGIVKHPGALPHWPPPIIKLFAGDCVVMKIKPKKLRLGDFHKNQLSKDESYFTPIVS
jgi:general stress protein 26